jgi:predicted RNA-binding protein with PIN domain
MKLLIDGYNLLRFITHGSATKSEIEQFLGRLRRYSRVTAHQIIVVFDGGDGLYRYQSTYHGLTIWYSGSRETADDLIKDFLPRYNANEVVLISDDRQLNAVAEAASIISVSPAVFIERMRAREEGGKAPLAIASLVKKSTSSSAELDALMAGATQQMPPEETETATSAKLKGKKSSKIKRRLDAVIQKL